MKFCREYARKRFEDAKKRGVANYGRLGNETRETGEEAHYHGLLAEAALVELFAGCDLTWNYYVDAAQVNVRSLPDLVIAGINVDAKAIAINRHSLLCKKGTVKPEWAYVLVGVELAPVCHLIGYMWGHGILKVSPENPRLKRAGHMIHQGDPRLHDFEKFVDLTGLQVTIPAKNCL